ncbi:MarR family winged helix-turn-helix transcriptional regulator [Paraburkholderia fungorum]|uniref:MarR family winged helix-turn-helix transcriptional regulator n=1 Tax=Paraburkholderia fungorum TaxID=134537 RepID=UPI001C1EC423|nr:MarR family transcriptional regulator [Paraburkholderia fungorum]MBU7442645.1 MarR family transcriptional regulator [Paraburkholderia fungorum]
MPTRQDDRDALSKYTGSLVRRAQQRHIAVWLAEVSADITSVQYAALEVLHRTPGVNQRQLGDQLDVDRSTIADLVSRMVRNGLVERSDDSVDKRSYVLFLTAAGKKQLAALRPRVEKVERVLTERLTPRECLELRRLLLALLPIDENMTRASENPVLKS